MRVRYSLYALVCVAFVMNAMEAPCQSMMIVRDADGIEYQDAEGQQRAHLAWQACQDGDIQTVVSHIYHDNVNSYYLLSGWTLLHCVARAKNERLVHQYCNIAQLLINMGAYLEDKDMDGNTALHVSAMYGNTMIAEVLINAGARVGVPNDWGETPLYFTTKIYDDKEFAEKIINAGDVNLDAKTYRNGETPLYIAALRGCNAVVEVLLDNGACVEEANEAGQTPLYVAASYDRSSIVEILIAHGASLTKRNNYGRAPNAVAQRHVAPLLLRRIPKIERENLSYQYVNRFTQDGARSHAVMALGRECYANADKFIRHINDPVCRGHVIIAALQSKWKKSGYMRYNTDVWIRGHENNADVVGALRERICDQDISQVLIRYVLERYRHAVAAHRDDNNATILHDMAQVNMASGIDDVICAIASVYNVSTDRRHNQTTPVYNNDQKSPRDIAHQLEHASFIKAYDEAMHTHYMRGEAYSMMQKAAFADIVIHVQSPHDDSSTSNSDRHHVPEKRAYPYETSGKRKAQKCTINDV